MTFIIILTGRSCEYAKPYNHTVKKRKATVIIESKSTDIHIVKDKDSEVPNCTAETTHVN